METIVNIKKGDLLIPKELFEKLKLHLFAEYAAFCSSEPTYPISEIYYIRLSIDNSEYIYRVNDSLYSLDINRFFKKKKDIPKKAIISYDNDIDVVIPFKNKEYKLLFKVTLKY